jgi:hypothetical protein
MRRKLARRAVLGSLPLMVLAAVAGTAGARAPSATVQFLGQAQLQPDGQVVVRVNYSCSPDSSGTGGELVVEARQVGAIGIGSLDEATCDGRKHQAELFVGDGPFTAGSAAATATVGNLAGRATTQVVLKVR